MFCRRRVVLAALIAFGGERSALAETALEPVALSYLAPEGCPSFEQFVAEIQRSTPRLRLARVGETARHFEAKIAPDGLQGQLTLDGGLGGERAVSAADCRAVADLLAFAVALAADPEAQPAEPVRAVAAFPALRPATPARVAPSAIPAPGQPPTPVPAASPSAPRRGWKWGVAGVGLVTGGSMPAPTFGGGALAELELSALSWAPHFRLGANYARTTIAEPLGEVALTTQFLTFELCSGAIRRGSFTLLPCLRAQGGARSAVGHDPLPGARGEERGFVDLGAAALGRFRFTGPAFVELGAALLFSTVRDQVVVRQGKEVKEVYEVPTLGLLGQLSLGVELGDQRPN